MNRHDRRVARRAATALLLVTPIAAPLEPTAAFIAITVGGITLIALARRPKGVLA